MNPTATRWNIDLVREFIEMNSDIECKLISEEYVNVDSKLEFQCKCGNLFKTTWYYFVSDKKWQCNDCGMKRIGIAKKHTYLFIKNYISNMGYEIVDETYMDNKTPITFKDNDNYHYYMPFTSIKNLKNKPSPFWWNNPYIINNIKIWLKVNAKDIELIDDTYKNSRTKILWKCLRLNCGEIFDAGWDRIQAGDECPYCAGHRVGLSNCLTTLNPTLSKEWHPLKNGNVTPYDVTCSNNNRYWWQCGKHPKHEWLSTVANRNKGSGCPYCAGHLPSEDYNLLVNNPTLCKEWNYGKNKNVPDQYTPFSEQKVWWACKECGNEWQGTISYRNSKASAGCPKCGQSKGEKQIANTLTAQKIIHDSQKSYNGLLGVGNRLLSYDFYLPEYNLLIEYQGEQHEHPVDFYSRGKKHAEEAFKKQQEHDRRKRTYAQNNNIKLLEIWYYDFDNIETILTEYLNKCNQEEGGIII